MKAVPQLTDRQEEIFGFLADGLTSKEVAKLLGISFRTVEVHILRAQERFGVHSRLQAVILWDRARREAPSARPTQARQGFTHCSGCGGLGFVREAA